MPRSVAREPTSAVVRMLQRIDRKVRLNGFLERLSKGLDRSNGPPLETIEALVRHPPVGLRSEGWIVVLCHEDGSATYHLPPTTAFHRVTNADVFCGALEVRLPSSRFE